MKTPEKLKKYPEIALLNMLRNHLRLRFGDDEDLKFALRTIDEIKKIILRKDENDK